MLNLYKGKKRFYLIGHSFGALVAIELAKILEKNGLTGQVVCTDGSVSLFKRFLRVIMPNMEATIDNVQNFLLAQLAYAILPDITPEAIAKIIIEGRTYDERANKTISLMTNPEYSHAYLKEFGYGLCNRVKMIMKENEEYTGEQIQANITLIRPQTNLVLDIDNDYNLKQYTSGQVLVSFIEGNHLTMLDNIQLYQIINNICTNQF